MNKLTNAGFSIPHLLRIFASLMALVVLALCPRPATAQVPVCNEDGPFLYVQTLSGDNSAGARDDGLKIAVQKDGLGKLEVYRDGIRAWKSDGISAFTDTKDSHYTVEIPYTFEANRTSHIQLERRLNKIAVVAHAISGKCSSHTIEISTVSNDLWAVIVGRNDYSENHFKSLSFAEDDADAIRDHLEQGLGVPQSNVLMITNQNDVEPTNILRQIGRMRHRMKPQDTFLFYYSGHGFYSSSNRYFPDQYYFVMAEPDMFNGYTFLSRSRLLQLLSTFADKRVIAILDACYSGTSVSAVRATTRKPKRVVPKLAGESVSSSELLRAEDKTYLIKTKLYASSQGNEPSFETPDLNQSLFTHYLLAASDEIQTDIVDNTDGTSTIVLDEIEIVISSEQANLFREWRKDKLITLDEAFQYAAWRVPNYLQLYEGSIYTQTPDSHPPNLANDLPWLYFE